MCRGWTFVALMSLVGPIWRAKRDKEVRGGAAGAGYRTLSKVTLRLFDTASRSAREFEPLARGKASVYLCGATVQAPPHIGQLRSGVSFDILVRWLRVTGFEVTFCRNVTDIDDKILRVAGEQGIQWWVVAERNPSNIRLSHELQLCASVGQLQWLIVTWPRKKGRRHPPESQPGSIM